jgi:hypothetical protein
MVLVVLAAIAVLTAPPGCVLGLDTRRARRRRGLQLVVMLGAASLAAVSTRRGWVAVESSAR